MKYWDLNAVVTKQRIFNFINGPRSIGKSYTLQKWLISQGIKKGKASIYIFRNDYDKRSAGIMGPFSKVLALEYPGFTFKSKGDILYWEDKPLVYAISLSQVQKLKKQSYPDVYYIMFDEYAIEDGTGKYLNGWGEPELFINFYHTADREEQRIKCFFLGNNTSFYNPYHAYPAFGIPNSPDIIQKKGIWMNEITLFQMAGISPELAAEKARNPVLRALQGTRYGQYATEGVYRDDNYNYIIPVDPASRYMANIECDGEIYGLFNNWDSMTLVFSDKYNPTCKVKYSLNKRGMASGFPYLKDNHKYLYALLRKYVINEQVGFVNMRVKAKVFPELMKML